MEWFDVLIVLMVFGTTLVGYDSTKIMEDIPKEDRRRINDVTSPAGWVIFCLLLWIICFPTIFNQYSMIQFSLIIGNWDFIDTWSLIIENYYSASSVDGSSSC